MNRDDMWRVLATHWEAEMFTECWCADPESAITIGRALARLVGDLSVQVDSPKGADGKRQITVIK